MAQLQMCDKALALADGTSMVRGIKLCLVDPQPSLLTLENMLHLVMHCVSDDIPDTYYAQALAAILESVERQLLSAAAAPDDDVVRRALAYEIVKLRTQISVMEWLKRHDDILNQLWEYADSTSVNALFQVLIRIHPALESILNQYPPLILNLKIPPPPLQIYVTTDLDGEAVAAAMKSAFGKDGDKLFRISDSSDSNGDYVALELTSGQVRMIHGGNNNANNDDDQDDALKQNVLEFVVPILKAVKELSKSSIAIWSGDQCIVDKYELDDRAIRRRLRNDDDTTDSDTEARSVQKKRRSSDW
jgi:hypothetical protein